MNVVVIGAGGVGGYFGARLAAAGIDVTFVARGQHYQAMQQQGLKIESPLGNLTLNPVKVVATLAEAPVADWYLLAVKLWDTEAVAVQLQQHMAPHSAVISFQNGVEKDEILRRYLNPGQIVGGTCYIAAAIAAPGVIRHGGTMAKLVFGEYGAASSVRCQQLLQACQKAAIEAELSANIAQLIWEKFVFLVGLSGTTSLFRCSIGPVRDEPSRRQLLQQTMAEVVAVARAKGIALHEDFASKRLAFADTLPAEMPSSMKLDLDRGHRLELPWLSGAVSEMGKRYGVATPANDRITAELAPFVAGR